MVSEIARDFGIPQEKVSELVTRAYEATLAVAEAELDKVKGSGKFNSGVFFQAITTILSGFGATITDRVKIIGAVNEMLQSNQKGEDLNGMPSSIADEALQRG